MAGVFLASCHHLFARCYHYLLHVPRGRQREATFSSRFAEAVRCRWCSVDDRRDRSLRGWNQVTKLLSMQSLHGLTQIPSSVDPDAPQGWRTPYVLVFIILGFPMIASFVWWEGRFPHPLIPMKVWRDKEFSLVHWLCSPERLLY